MTSHAIEAKCRERDHYMHQVAVDLMESDDPVAQVIGQNILRCIQCNASPAREHRRCDTCPFANDRVLTRNELS
ncbi:hypothetical protein ACFSM5_04815 [Lacibacterium aquatile]|uniref:Uncharacterized protein n=1 Tax=Lacibacterium aquatile TaxID=1168082 RepID=A0ABW5DQH8_9PROT